MGDPAGRAIVAAIDQRGLHRGARNDADLDEPLTPHCLRHFEVTHWTDFGYPARFVQDKLDIVCGDNVALHPRKQRIPQSAAESVADGPIWNDWKGRRDE